MVNIKLSNRARNTPPSPIRKLAHLANNARRSGTHVYALNIGQPDIESPQEFFDGLNLFKQKIVAYDQSQGNENLCKAWSRYVNRTLQVQTSPEQFLITMGASEALVFLFMTCCDPGDEVIIFDPTYANYPVLRRWPASPRADPQQHGRQLRAPCEKRDRAEDHQPHESDPAVQPE